MIKSAKPRKQRYFRFNASMHQRQKFLHVHISKELQQKLGIKKRSMQIKKGDTVKVMKGKFRGKSGKINTVDLRKNRITVETITRKTAKNKEIPIPIYASSVYITDLDLTDKLRSEKVNSFKKK